MTLPNVPLPTTGFPSTAQYLAEVIGNQQLAASALLEAAKLLTSQHFLDIRDNATGRRVRIAVTDISRIEELASGKATIFTVNDSNFVSQETYDVVLGLMT